MVGTKELVLGKMFRLWFFWKSYIRPIVWWFRPPHKWVDFSKQPSLAEIAADWTWRWEYDDKFTGIRLNVGTKERPEWAMLR